MQDTSMHPTKPTNETLPHNARVAGSAGVAAPDHDTPRPDPPLSTDAPPTSTETKPQATSPGRRISPATAAWWAAAVIATTLAALTLFSPYNRGILGEYDGARQTVETECAAPVIAAVSQNGTRQLDANGQWTSDEPPCQRSAAYRLVLGGVLFVCAGGLGLRARRSHGAVDDDDEARR